MSDLVNTLARNSIVASARSRDEKATFGTGVSIYPIPFKQILSDTACYLSVYNTPTQPQVNWNLRDVTVSRDAYGPGVCLLFSLTEAESLALAAEIGLPITGWLSEALAACRSDVTPTSAVRGNEIEPAAFHVGRAND